jgi:chemotaxis protein CheX
MSEQFQPDEITAVIRTATQELFSTMLNLPLEPLASFQEATTKPPSSQDGVEALVGIAGSWTGTGRICCTSKLACTLAGAMLMMTCESLNEDVLDAMSEIANMIIGNVKTELEERLGPLGLSIPTVIFGRNYKTRSAGVSSWVVVPFMCKGDTLQIRFCLIPTPRPHAAGTHVQAGVSQRLETAPVETVQPA